ncbi:MAG TPA: dTDP-4-dehydrorhamnose 3,5-epimerase [Flavobacteriaceae bacterium]|nr:dTDP-4-dehydrorhamnose 3,5-epimerase [Flavobacteriaceae bacterium]
MTVEKTPLQDCLLLKPRVMKDDRGSFFESYNHREFQKATGLEIDFVQDNQSSSKKGALRGLHLQLGKMAQAKLVRVIQGEILDVVVDVRKNSPSFGKTYRVVLSGENNHQLFIPRGFAHGFVTLSETAIFAYKCDNYYDKAAESGIIFNDEVLNIDWNYPLDQVILSEKDAVLPDFEEFLRRQESFESKN